VTETTLSLRERKKLNTRQALSDAALHLVFERGLDNVNREDIAERAGVSVRTFNNYFAGKFEALAYRQIARMQRSVALLRQRPADEPLWTAVTAAVLEPVCSDGVGFGPPTAQHLAALRPLLALPEMRAVVGDACREELMLAIAERAGMDPQRDLYPHLAGAAIGAAYGSAMEMYLFADPPVPLIELLRDALDNLAAGLREPTPGR
jgi:AcrR family transcriptional regulator